MKKVSLVLGMVLFAGMAMSQNSVSTTQIGGSNKAIVSQSGAKNDATIRESGNFNEASVTQTGLNEATIEQNSSAANVGEKNLITVNQSSSELKSAATVYQGKIPGYTSKKATATVDQTGAGNNKAEIYMHFTSSGQNDGSFIVQDGKDNYAKSDLRSNQGQYEFTSINQKGFDNSATQLKNDEREGSMIIKQTSFTEDMGNTATQYTRKDHARALYIEQIGAKNSANEDIFKGSNATIVQYGDWNTAEIYSPWESASNNAAILQGDVTAVGLSKTVGAGLVATSSNNWAKLEQANGSNTATLVQKGLGNNTINLKQNGSDFADIMQDGYFNKVKGLGVNIWAKGKSLTVDQIGTRNELSIEADGTVGVTQDNHTIASASALGNKIEFSQAGGGTSNLSQTGGDANLIKLTKTGGGSADITQTGNTNKVAMFDDVFGAAGVTGAALFN